MVSLSCEVDPAFREYERTCVTAFDAYVKPVVGRYLEAMERDLAGAGVGAPLQIMQSRGGVCSSSVARRRPVRLFLSGPAAGVVGALEAGRQVGLDDLITVDIGGTSCDVALVSGGIPLNRAESTIAGYSVRVPSVDITTIGAGGGSIAWLDAGGALRVGPESAGSEPGPACYDRGGEAATVTDASLILGYIDPDYFAGGSLKLVPYRAREAVARTIAQPLGISVEAAALGIHRVLNAQMSEADPPRLDRPRHRSARLRAAAIGRRRPAARLRAGPRTRHNPRRRADPSWRALRRRPAVRADRTRDIGRVPARSAGRLRGRKSGRRSTASMRPAAG